MINSDIRCYFIEQSGNIYYLCGLKNYNGNFVNMIFDCATKSLKRASLQTVRWEGVRFKKMYKYKKEMFEEQQQILHNLGTYLN